MKNNNGASIRRLSNRSLQNNRMRNTFAVIAIILTCILFTAAFSLTSGAMQVAQEETMREVGTKAHVGLKAATMEQYNKITSDSLVKSSNYNIFIGIAENILKRQAELRYTPEKTLDDMFIILEEGSMPMARNEIVVDTFIMDELQLPYALGVTIPLTFDFMGEKIEKEFSVCGYYQGDYISHASELFLSEAYWNELKGDLSEADFQKWGDEHPNYRDVGLMAVNIHFYDSSDLEAKIRTVIENAGYNPDTDIRYGVNWAYMSSRLASLDTITYVMLSFAIIVILLSGYLIIYNIFQISVISDIRFYGLLKTIGTTRRQIRRLINRQALILSIIGIPIGLVIGFIIGKATLPFTLSFMQYDIPNISLKFNLWIMVFGAAFSALTVFISCRKPGKIAADISPIEAVKYTQTDNLKKRSLHKKKNRAVRISPISMAAANLARNKRTTTVVVAAISLSIVLLAIIMTAVNSFRLDRYVEQRIVGDYLLGNVSITSTSSRSGDVSIDENYLKSADSLEGITQRSEMWVTYGSDILLDDKAVGEYHKLDEAGKLRRDEYSNADKLLSGEGMISGYLYSYDKELLNNLKVIEGSLDIDKFEGGNYILLGTMNGNDNMTLTDHVYRPGDKVTVESIAENSTFHIITNDAGEPIDVLYDDLEQTEYEVMAIVDIPYSMNLHRYTENACDFILPISELSFRSECFAVSYTVDESCKPAFEATVKDYCENINKFMGYMSKSTLLAEFEGMLFVVSAIGIALAVVIALIGILNFINAMITEIISRKREFAMLQSIGMTAGQLQKTLMCEGVCYICIAEFIGFIIGSLLSWKILEALNNVLLFFEYRFRLLPFLIMLPLLLLIAVLTPFMAFKQLKKKSIVERLRESE